MHVARSFANGGILCIFVWEISVESRKDLSSKRLILLYRLSSE